MRPGKYWLRETASGPLGTGAGAQPIPHTPRKQRKNPAVGGSRETFLEGKWRRERDWVPTFSISNPLISNTMKTGFLSFKPASAFFFARHWLKTKMILFAKKSGFWQRQIKARECPLGHSLREGFVSQMLYDRDSRRDSSMVAVWNERLDPDDIEDPELVCLSSLPEAARLPCDPV